MIYDDIHALAIERFKALDLDTDAEFKEFVQMASAICNTPIALITLLEEDIQWLKVKKGTDVEKMPTKTSFCTHTIQLDEVMMVADTKQDIRFADNPIVVGEPNIRFYAGTPLITREGDRIGTLCVFDIVPHELDNNQLQMLKMLGKQAINLMDFRISVEMLAKNKIEVEQQKEVIKKTGITLRSFFESSSNFHILLDKNGDVIDYNKVAYNFIKKMHGVKMTRGTRFIKFLAADSVDSFTRNFDQALAGKKAFEEGSTDYGLHGLMYWEASFETAKDANNEIIGVSYIIRDVTDRKIKEQKIIEQNKSLLKIAHLQTHEFRAPITSIIGMMNLIKDENYNAPREYYEMLGSAVQKFDDKIQEIVSNIDTALVK